MNAFRQLSHPSESLKPLKKMLLQEFVYLVVVAKLRAASFNMLGLVTTSVLDLRRKIFLNLASLYIGYKLIRSVHATDVLLE
jgi:hypothetical protein